MAIRLRALSAEERAALLITLAQIQPKDSGRYSYRPQIGNLSPSFTEPYTLICTYTVQVVLSILAGLIAVIIAYGAIGATIIGLLGPVFIPWMVFEKTDFLFWGWLKAFSDLNSTKSLRQQP